jgi:hypothetical protein
LEVMLGLGLESELELEMGLELGLELGLLLGRVAQSQEGLWESEAT